MQLLPDAVKPSLVFNCMNMTRSVARLLTNQTEYKLGAIEYRCLHWPGASVPRWSPHPSLWCCSSPSSSTIR